MKLFIISILIINSVNILAQSNSDKLDVGKIALSIVMPESIEDQPTDLISKLETKVMQIVTNSGLGASGINNNFVIYPKMSIMETNVIEGGLQNMFMLTVDFSLFIKQVENNVLFASINKTIKANGTSKQAALINAISKINVSDPEYDLFIKKGKSKIVSYYETHCDDILNKSEMYLSQNQFEQALGILFTVPEEITSCFIKVQKKVLQSYQAYQNQKCSELILKAKTSIGANENSQALETLSQIDPSSICIKEAQNLISKAASKVSADEKKEWEMKVKIYSDAVSLEKRRINAAKQIAISYFQNQPKQVNYMYIIR